MMRYPGRVHATSIENPDFPALAAAYGMTGCKVERTRDSVPAFQNALGARSSSLIELRIDAEAITTRTTLSALRRAAESRPG